MNLHHPHLHSPQDGDGNLHNPLHLHRHSRSHSLLAGDNLHQHNHHQREDGASLNHHQGGAAAAVATTTTITPAIKVVGIHVLGHKTDMDVMRRGQHVTEIIAICVIGTIMDLFDHRRIADHHRCFKFRWKIIISFQHVFNIFLLNANFSL